MSTIFLMRHGQDEDNAVSILNGRRDTPLTDLGVEKAKITAGNFKDKNIQVIMVSPLLRAEQTAKIVADEIGVKNIITDDRLIERDFGVLTGRPVTDIPKYAQEVIQGDLVRYFLGVPEAEEFPQVYQRAKEVLEDIKQKYPDQNVLIVAHGDFDMMARAAFYNWGWRKGLEAPYFENASVVELK
jgi:broad specificity phosphatase PhoE